MLREVTLETSGVCALLFLSPWTAARQASLSFTNSWNLLKFMSIELVMPSKHLMLGCPLIILPSIFSSIRIFSNESAQLFGVCKHKGKTATQGLSLVDNISSPQEGRMAALMPACMHLGTEQLSEWTVSDHAWVIQGQLGDTCGDALKLETPVCTDL